MAIRYTYELASDERDVHESLVKSGQTTSREVKLSQALLLADSGPLGPGWPTRAIAASTL
ncbi:MAG: hypothetical protein LBR11_11385 [Deltaproteobacteria bacterium]|jgi:hypothetical protein|nr:hypothetical protein [Deltaproteobacteria bacterium]